MIVIVSEWFTNRGNLGDLLSSTDLPPSLVTVAAVCLLLPFPRDQLSIMVCGQHDVFLLDFFSFFSPFDVDVVVVCLAAVAVIVPCSFYIYSKTHRTCEMLHFLCNQAICLRKKGSGYRCKVSHC